MMPYLKGLHLTIYGWIEGRYKYLYKTKSQPRVCLNIWYWKHDNLLEENEFEELRIYKDKSEPVWIDPSPRCREEIVELKGITAPDKPAVTRC